MKDTPGDELRAPNVADRSAFEAELDALRVREKAHTHEGDSIAAARRRLPMVEVDGTATLIGPQGAVTLLDTFEGQRDLAIRKAEALGKLPTMGAGPLMRLRVRRLRRGVLAFARAFAHRATPRDAKWLGSAAKTSPLVHWAMRYAGAVIAVDSGDRERARKLLEGAPDWPMQSAFRTFDEELRSALT